jgi:hypothetical protein
VAVSLEVSALARDRREILDTISQYENAYRSRSVDRIKGVYPKISKKEQNDLRATFNVTKTISLRLKPEPDFSIDGDKAAVRCRRELIQNTEEGPQAPVDDWVTLDLARTGGTWKIVSLVSKQ